MYCKNCGKEIPDGVKFCPKCGEAIDSISITQTNKEREAQQTRSVGKGVLLAIVAIIGLLVGIMGLINLSKVWP